MGTLYTAADWVPRDDMAVLADCSVDTIRRDEKKHGLETRTDDAGRVLVNVGDFLRIGRLRDADLTAGATPAESAAVVRSRQAEAALREQVARLEGKLVQADLVVETLREQLGAKDKQLAKRDDQITQLTTLLGRFAAMGGAA
jgi:hypothetical protein